MSNQDLYCPELDTYLNDSIEEKFQYFLALPHKPLSHNLMAALVIYRASAEKGYKGDVNVTSGGVIVIKLTKIVNQSYYINIEISPESQLFIQAIHEKANDLQILFTVEYTYHTNNAIQAMDNLNKILIKKYAIYSFFILYCAFLLFTIFKN